MTAVVSVMMAMHGVAAAQTAPATAAPTPATPAAGACPNGWTRSDDGDCDPPKGEVLGFSIAGLNHSAAAAPATPAAATPVAPASYAATHVAALNTSHVSHVRAHGRRAHGWVHAPILANFAVGSADAGAGTQDHVRTFVSRFGSGLKGKHVIVNGHTDARGSRRLNLRLSRERAETVKAMLIKAGLTQEVLEVRGFGYDHLLRPRNPYAAANRRVDVVVVSN